MLSGRIALLSLVILLGFGIAAANADTVAFKVTDSNGAPISGAKVTYGASACANAADLTMGAGGEFAIDVPHNAYDYGWVIVQAQGFGIEGTVLTAKSGASIHLAPPRTVTGFVYDAAGKPAAGVHVRATDIVIAGPDGAPRVLTLGPAAELFGAVTDSSGRFSISGLPRDADVCVSIVEPGLAGIRADFGARGQSAPLVALPGAEIDGQVLFSDGTPAAGIRVTTFTTDSADCASEAVTDSQGRYRLSGLASGSYGVGASMSDNGMPQGYVLTSQLGRLETMPVSIGKPAEYAPLTLVRAETVSGVVSDAISGKAMAGVKLSATRVSDSMPYFESEGVSGVDGRYSLLVEPGFDSVKVYVPDHGYDKWIYGQNGGGVKSVNTANGAAELPFRLMPLLSAAGRAIDAKGKPVSGTCIMFLPGNSRRLGEPDNPAYVLPHATTNKSGAFKCDLMGSDKYTIWATDPWIVVGPKQVDAPLKGPVLVHLKRGKLVSLTAKVTDTTGEPIPGILVSVDVYSIGPSGMSGAQFQEVRTDGKGRFTITGLGPDDIMLPIEFSSRGWHMQSGGRVPDFEKRLTLNSMIPANLGVFSLTDIVMARD